MSAADEREALEFLARYDAMVGDVVSKRVVLVPTINAEAAALALRAHMSPDELRKLARLLGGVA